MGRILFVDLSSESIMVKSLDDELYNRFLGGYGVAARVLYDLMKPHIDPLGPSNWLGLVTGPLTGTSAVTGNRFTAVGKSPLTLSWGDANCGGGFGPFLKFSGFDAVFITGASDRPRILLISDCKATLLNAGDLWGKDVVETENALHNEFGNDAQVASIGPAGERLSLSAGIMNEKYRAAARSALGAVMGSKQLKAVVARGREKVPIANESKLNEARKKIMDEILVQKVGFSEVYTKLGTPGVIESCAVNGDSPVKNWDGVGAIDFKNSSSIGYEALKRDILVKKCGCWHCPIACSGMVEVKEGQYKVLGHQAEYETAAAFGSLCLNDNPSSIIKANDICNRYGMDTIATGALIAFTIECYENGLITREDTDGLEMKWGNHAAIVSMTEKIGRREGFGNILADGIENAVKYMGKQSEKYAIHVGGEMLPMHDPRFEPALAAIYKMDATPGRHTQGANFNLPPKYDLEKPSADSISGRGKALRTAMCLMHVVNCAGICLFSFLSTSYTALAEQLSAVIGIPYETNDLILVGERIHNMRHVFNLREGINPIKRKVPQRILESMQEGPNKGRRVDIDTMTTELLNEFDWNHDTTIPSEGKLAELGLDDPIFNPRAQSLIV